jgi:hypothetical protein
MSETEKDLAPTATTLERAINDHQGFYLAVRRAKRLGHPLYHVRHRTGVTVDLTLTIQEARKVRGNSVVPRNVDIYELKGSQQVRIAA